MKYVLIYVYFTTLLPSDGGLWRILRQYYDRETCEITKQISIDYDVDFEGKPFPKGLKNAFACVPMDESNVYPPLSSSSTTRDRVRPQDGRNRRQHHDPRSRNLVAESVTKILKP